MFLHYAKSKGNYPSPTVKIFLSDIESESEIKVAGNEENLIERYVNGTL